MPVLYQTWIYQQDLILNPDALYLFGDNEARVGRGGQAKEMRGQPNAVGIRTKRSPGTEESAYWGERNCEEFLKNIQMVLEDFRPIWNRLREEPDLVVILPAAGFGTDLAQLAVRAPNTLKYTDGWHSMMGRKDFPDSTKMSDLEWWKKRFYPTF